MKTPPTLRQAATSIPLFLLFAALVWAEFPRGRWQLQAEISPGHNLVLDIFIDGSSNQPVMSLHLLAAEARAFGLPSEAADLPLSEVTYDGSSLAWTVPLPAQPARCTARLREDGKSLEGNCEQGDQTIPIRLIPSGQVGPVEVEEVSEAQRPFLDAVHRVVLAADRKDYPAFERLFSEHVKGLAPDELWQGASVVLLKFGRVKKIGFSEADGDGAFVRVTFEQAERELYLRLDEKGLIRELAYVPPLNADTR